MEIDVTHPFEIAGSSVSKITVRPIMFASLVRITGDATDKGHGFAAALLKARIAEQADFRDGKGAPLKPTEADIDKMPMPVAKAIRDALDDGQGEAGTLVRDGDGVSSPVLYRLNTPLKIMSGKEEVAVEELEFAAATLMEAQQVLAEDSALRKAHLLLLKLAKPVGVKSLMVLPATLVDQVTVGDGVGIMRLVVPKF